MTLDEAEKIIINLKAEVAFLRDENEKWATNHEARENNRIRKLVASFLKDINLYQKGVDTVPISIQKLKQMAAVLTQEEE